MSAPARSSDLLDLKLLPAWVNEPSRANEYSNFEGEEARAEPPRSPGRSRAARRRDEPPRRGPRRERRQAGRGDRATCVAIRSSLTERRAASRLPAVTVRFLPHAPAFESVIAQIKSGSVAYSCFALARLFLEKPERYDVRLPAPEQADLFQLGENGAVSTDRIFWRTNAFAVREGRFLQGRSHPDRADQGQLHNVARCRLSGTLLGPTNHHNLSAAVAQSLRAALQPADEFRRLSAADRDRERSGGGRTMEGTGAQRHDLHDEARASRRSRSTAPPRRNGIFARIICRV